MKRKCRKCGIEQDLEQFYKYKKMKSGRVNTCKKCYIKLASERQIEKRCEIREYNRARYEKRLRLIAEKSRVEKEILVAGAENDKS